MNRNYIETLKEHNIEFIENAPMSKYTSFKTGGSASLLVLPKTIDEVVLLKDLFDKYIVLGNCTNVVVSDDGLDVPVIYFGSNFNAMSIENNILKAQSGVKLAQLYSYSVSNGFTGLEFLSGIPGSVGGAIYMNAGAYGPEIADVLKSAVCLDENGRLVTVENKDCDFSYRHSGFMKKNCIILGGEFILEKGDTEESRAYARELNTRRKDKQPLEYPSAGSVFKRPEGYFAGKLIEDSGLKGCQIGGAQVSEKHAGFIINKGGATSMDIINLIKHVQEVVYNNYQVKLETEIRFLGYDKEVF